MDFGCDTRAARFDLDWDMSDLFPYINAEAEHAQLYAKPVYIRFELQGHLCSFHPKQGAFTPVANFNEAFDFLGQLIEFISQIYQRRSRITPDFKTYNPLSAVEIYRLLPGSNCRACGFTTCLAFAAALSRNHISLLACPHLSNPVEESVTFPVYDHDGNCIRKVSLQIDLTGFRRTIEQKDSHIHRLQSQLVDHERLRKINLDKANTTLPSPLTDREAQVLRLVAKGATNKDIAEDLKISTHTVKSHIIHIFNKLGLNDRTQASVWAASRGLL